MWHELQTNLHCLNGMYCLTSLVTIVFGTSSSPLAKARGACSLAKAREQDGVGTSGTFSSATLGWGSVLLLATVPFALGVPSSSLAKARDACSLAKAREQDGGDSSSAFLSSIRL